MPPLLNQIPLIDAAINNAALADPAALSQALDLAEAVNQPPANQEVAQFLDLLITPPAMLPPGAPARWVPTPGQQLALQSIVGAPGPVGVMGFPLYNVGGFLNGVGPLCFVNFNRELITLQLIIRVADPKRINQRAHPLCGPNVLMESFARSYPQEYADYVIGLCTNRTGDIATANGTKQIHLEQNSNLLSANPPSAEIRQADYVALASLRDQGHWFIHTPYRSNYTSQLLEGGTMAMTLTKWLEDAGYQNVEDHTLSRTRNLAAKLVFYRPARAAYGDWLMRGNVQLAIARLIAGRNVFLCMASNFAHFSLNQGPNRDATYIQAFGGHYATLVAAVIQPNGVDFAIRTWGTETAAAVTMPWSKIGNWYRGFISATP